MDDYDKAVKKYMMGEWPMEHEFPRHELVLVKDGVNIVRFHLPQVPRPGDIITLEVKYYIVKQIVYHVRKQPERSWIAVEVQ